MTFNLSARRVALAVAAVFVPAMVQAGDTVLVAGDAGSSYGNYGYVGLVTALSGQTLDRQDGWLGRFWLAHTRFKYDIPAGTIKGKGPSIEAAIGYQKYLSPTARLTGYLGAVHRNIGLSPDDPNSRVDDRDNGAKLQVEFAARPADKIDLWAGASYTGTLRDHWAKLRAGYLLNDRLSVGPEFEAVSGDAYSKHRVGVSLEGIALSPNAAVGLRLGREDDRRNSRDATYFGISFTNHF